MSKGSRLDQFEVGQHVEFRTDVGHSVYKKVRDEQTGKMVSVFSHRVHIDRTDRGRIVKLHKSGSQGVAEIRPDGDIPGTGIKKISRRLQHVNSVK